MRNLTWSLVLLLALIGCNKPVICYVIPVCVELPELVDEDGDGFDELIDCDDQNADVNPAAAEVRCDGLDNDCDDWQDEGRGGDYADADEDGAGDPDVFLEACEMYNAGSEGVDNADDCDDTDPDSYLGAPEVPGDGIDQDCDGEDLDEEVLDADGDGFDADADCDDDNAFVNPVADEVCDLLDNDCDELVDDEDDSVTGGDVYYADKDQDGYGSSNKANQITACEQPPGYAVLSKDCDDGDKSIHPGATEACTDLADLNCDGAFGAEDNDGDGVFACEECDDQNDAVYPGATEVCNGVDDNCADGVDEGVLITWYQDADKDLYGSELVTKDSCSAPPGFGPDGGDCDDSRPTVNPGEDEVCNNRDDDCNGVVDNGVELMFYADKDQDGYGDGTSTTKSCTPPVGFVANQNDCKDTNKNINPSATEVCDAVDNDCNGTVDVNAADAKTWYADTDKDGSGGQTSTKACVAPAGHVSTSTDCDDANALISPVGTEVCNGKDDNCDGSVDNGAKGSATYYLDNDKDGYGDKTQSVTQCSPPVGYVLDATDCDDAKNSINPGKTEVCNGVDDDCEGGVDEGVKNTYFADTDGDKYGNVLVTTLACSLPVGFVANSTDCDDTRALINPAATEVCNGADDDCDVAVDEGTLVTFYKDGDTDAYGDVNSTAKACAAPAGYVPSATDCNDGDKAVNPGAPEVCDGVDQDCDSVVDEGVKNTYYADTDSDKYGDAKATSLACSAPAGYVVDNTDCNDKQGTVNPAALEVCNGIDDNCDTKVDEGYVLTLWYRDSDGDGHGNPLITQSTCTGQPQPPGYVSSSSKADCDDTRGATFPGAPEKCNGLDDDCDGKVDNSCT